MEAAVIEIFESVAGFLKESTVLGDINETDVIYTRNRLLDLLGLPDYAEPKHIKKQNRLHYVDEMVKDAVKRSIINDTPAERDMLGSRIMDVITPAFSHQCRVQRIVIRLPEKSNRLLLPTEPKQRLY